MSQPKYATLGALKKQIDDLLEAYNPHAGCAFWIYTRDDVGVQLDASDYPGDEKADEILEILQNQEEITDNIHQCLDSIYEENCK